MFTCGWDGRSNFWDLTNKCHIKEFETNDQRYHIATFTQDGRYIFASDYGGKIFRYDTQEQTRELFF
jgi:WD40 repeat protein